MSKLRLLIYFLLNIRPIFTFEKVIVPALYDEWNSTGTAAPIWLTNETLRLENGYEIFLYQKSNPKGLNFIPTNRGSECKMCYLAYT